MNPHYEQHLFGLFVERSDKDLECFESNSRVFDRKI